MSTLQQLEKDLAEVFEKHDMQKVTSMPANALAQFTVTCISGLKSACVYKEATKK